MEKQQQPLLDPLVRGTACEPGARTPLEQSPANVKLFPGRSMRSGRARPAGIAAPAERTDMLTPDLAPDRGFRTTRRGFVQVGFSGLLGLGLPGLLAGRAAA